MEKVLFYSAIIVGLVALYKIAETTKYYIIYKDDIKPIITKWIPLLGISTLLFFYPSIWSVFIVLFASVLLALCKMILLTKTLTK